MKKVLLALFASLFIATPVFAAENKVYIYEADGKVYYDGALFNDRFMIHENMTPGSSYTDYLVVENGTSKDYDVYFKITANDNSVKADDLLEYIEMEISIDGTKYYDGKVKGLDYRDQGVDLTNAVLIKRFNAGDRATMKVDTYLDSNYGNGVNFDSSSSDDKSISGLMSQTQWTFYVVDVTGDEPTPGPEPEPTPTPTPTPTPEPDDGGKDKPVKPIPVVPKTNDDFSPWYFVIFGASAVVLIVLIFLGCKSKKKNKK
ncbi:hypothetical protein J6X09_00050 [Candidatus Saccharibacteria bacterium]|nr:hypothetical protein [Candidatus Saccharibacteria bacterium]